MFSILDIFWHVFSPFFGTLRPGAHPSGQAQGQAVMGESQKSPVECGIVVLLGDLGHVSLWQMVILTVWLFNLAMEQSPYWIGRSS